MATLHDDLVALVDPPPVKGSRVFPLVVVSLLMLAAHLRFDQHENLSARLLVLLGCGVWMAGPIARSFERRQRVLAEPHGFELFHAEVQRLKRRRWESLAPLPLHRYVNALAGSLGALILFPLFSATIVFAPRMPGTAAIPPSVVAWFAASTVAMILSASVMATGRKKAAASWASVDARSLTCAAADERL